MGQGEGGRQVKGGRHQADLEGGRQVSVQGYGRRRGSREAGDRGGREGGRQRSQGVRERRQVEEGCRGDT